MTNLCNNSHCRRLHSVNILLPCSFPFPSCSGRTISPSLSSFTSALFALVCVVAVPVVSSFPYMLIDTDAYISEKERASSATYYSFAVCLVWNTTF